MRLSPMLGKYYSEHCPYCRLMHAEWADTFEEAQNIVQDQIAHHRAVYAKQVDAEIIDVPKLLEWNGSMSLEDMYSFAAAREDGVE